MLFSEPLISGTHYSFFVSGTGMVNQNNHIKIKKVNTINKNLKIMDGLSNSDTYLL